MNYFPGHGIGLIIGIIAFDYVPTWVDMIFIIGDSSIVLYVLYEFIKYLREFTLIITRR